MQFFYHVRCGEMPPKKWLGACWFDMAKAEWVLCPMPLNLAMRIVRAFWIWLHRPIRFFDAAFENEYLRRRR